MARPRSRSGSHVLYKTTTQVLAYAKLGHQPPETLMTAVSTAAWHKMKKFTPQVTP